MNKRNNTYDLLKAIGLVFIMIAHCTNKPEGLEYIRNFEVILLVLVSAMLSYEKYNELCEWNRSTTQIIIKRLKRLVVPTWFFLGVFFSAIFCVTHIRGIAFPYSNRVVIESFLMINGIGYVWIMLVYCWITIGLPFLFLVFNRLKLSAFGKTVILAGGFFLYELIRHLILNCEGN